jgi:hypothetical protein
MAPASDAGGWVIGVADESLSLLMGCRRATAGLIHAAIRICDGAAAIQRFTRGVGPAIEGIRGDIRVMRETTERLDRRVANVQQDLTRFSLQVTNIEQITMALALDVNKITELLGENQKSTIARVKDALSGTTDE